MENKNLFIIIAVVAGFFLVGAFLSYDMMTYSYGKYGYGMMSGYYGMMGYNGFGFMMIFGWLFMILIVVALILFIIWLVKQIDNGKTENIRRKR